jgi:hypothetical protein
MTEECVEKLGIQAWQLMAVERGLKALQESFLFWAPVSRIQLSVYADARC